MPRKIYIAVFGQSSLQKLLWEAHQVVKNTQTPQATKLAAACGRGVGEEQLVRATTQGTNIKYKASLTSGPQTPVTSRSTKFSLITVQL